MLVKLKTPSPSWTGALEPGPLKLKAPSPNSELEMKQVKMKSPTVHLGPVKLEMALEREQVKPEVAGIVREVGEYSPWELSLGRLRTPLNVEGLFAAGLLERVTLKYITSPEKSQADQQRVSNVEAIMTMLARANAAAKAGRTAGTGMAVDTMAVANSLNTSTTRLHRGAASPPSHQHYDEHVGCHRP